MADTDKFFKCRSVDCMFYIPGGCAMEHKTANPDKCKDKMTN